MSPRSRLSAWTGLVLLLASPSCQDAPSPLAPPPTAPGLSGSAERPPAESPPAQHSSHFTDAQLIEALATPATGAAITAIRYLGGHLQVAVHSGELGGFPLDGAGYLVVSSGNAADPTGSSSVGYPATCRSDPEFGQLCDVGGFELDLAVPSHATVLELRYRYFAWDYNPFEDPFRIFLIAGDDTSRVAQSTLSSEIGVKPSSGFALSPHLRQVSIDVSGHQGTPVTLRLLASDRSDRILDAGALVDGLHFPDTNRAPHFLEGTPACGTTFEAHAGEPLAFTVLAGDPDASDQVTLSVAGLPEGAVSPLPEPGNPVSSTFTWTPAPDQVNQSGTVVYTVEDGQGEQATCGFDVTVANRLPTAVIDAPDTTAVGDAVQFDGTGSTDPDGNALLYAWDFDGDGITDASDPAPTHTYATAGTRTVTLTVSDGFGLSHTAATTVVVKQVIEISLAPPAAGAALASASPTSASGLGGLMVALVNPTTREFQIKLTDDEGRVRFELLSDQEVLITARRLAIRVDPGAPGDPANLEQLSVWPFRGDESQLPTTHESLGALVGVVYNGAARELTTDGYVDAVRNPLALPSGEGKREITLPFEAGATVSCTLLDPDGSPARFASGKRIYGVQPFTAEQSRHLYATLGENPDLPPGLAYNFASVTSGDDCALVGTPTGTTVLSTAPVEIDGEQLTYRTAVQVNEGEQTVEVIAGPSPVTSFVDYITSEPFGDVRGPADRGQADVGGLITAGYSVDGRELIVSTDFKGLGQYRLEIWRQDPGSAPRRPDLQVTATCAANQCSLSPRSPKADERTTAKGVFTFRRGVARGTLYWRVPTDADELWFRITTGGASEQTEGADSALDATAVFRVVKRSGTGNSHDVGYP